MFFFQIGENFARHQLGKGFKKKKRRFGILDEVRGGRSARGF